MSEAVNIYVLNCAMGRIYVGQTTDPLHRIQAHCNHVGAEATMIYPPVSCRALYAVPEWVVNDDSLSVEGHSLLDALESFTAAMQVSALGSGTDEGIVYGGRWAGKNELSANKARRWLWAVGHADGERFRKLKDAYLEMVMTARGEKPGNLSTSDSFNWYIERTR